MSKSASQMPVCPFQERPYFANFVPISKQKIMATKKFKANTGISLIRWTGKKITGTHNGTINLSDGFIEVEDGKITGGSFDIDTRSIVITDVKDEQTNAQFAGHLFSDDFFAVEKFPTAN